MPTFSSTSLLRLDTCHDDLHMLFDAVVRHRDCTIICGNRLRDEQDKLYAEGKSKLIFPNSKHNPYPSLAVDVAPYIQGKGVVYDARQVSHFAGYVLRVADELGLDIRWGGDWDNDKDINDQTFNDLVHYELR